MAFFDYPVYNVSMESEQRIINTDHIEQVKPHADVPVDPGAVSTPCVEFSFYSGGSCLVLLDFNTVRVGLKASFGVVDANGVMT